MARYTSIRSVGSTHHSQEAEEAGSQVRARLRTSGFRRVPLQEDGGVEAALRREVLPHAADAWFDESSQDSMRLAFNRYFYKPQLSRSLDDPAVTSWQWRRRPRASSLRSSVGECE